MIENGLLKKANWGITVLLVLIMTIVTACSSSPKATSKAPVTIRFSFWGSPEEKAVQEQLKGEFEKIHPEIIVTLDQVSSAADFPAAVLTQIAGGKAPDVFYIGEALVSSFVNKGVLKDIYPLAQADGYDFSDYFPALLEPMGYKENHLWALPKDATPYMMYYNKDVFDKSNVPYPQVNWTWSDFEKTAKALTKREGDKATQYGFAQDLWWGPEITAIYKNGGKLISADAKTMTLDDPKVAEALDWYKNLMYKDGGVSPTPDALTSSGVGTVDLFLSGKAAMVSGGRWVSFSLKPLKGKWGVVPFPQNTSSASPLLFVTLAMPKNTQHPQEAYQFIKFMTSKRGQEVNSATGLGMPVLKSVTNSGSWLQEGEAKENIKIYYDQLSGAQSLPFHPLWAKTIDEVYTREMDPAFRNKAEVKDALKKAQEQAAKIMAGQ